MYLIYSLHILTSYIIISCYNHYYYVVNLKLPLIFFKLKFTRIFKIFMCIIIMHVYDHIMSQEDDKGLCWLALHWTQPSWSMKTHSINALVIQFFLHKLICVSRLSSTTRVNINIEEFILIT